MFNDHGRPRHAEAPPNRDMSLSDAHGLGDEAASGRNITTRASVTTSHKGLAAGLESNSVPRALST
jgi:hypothetical protein